MRAFGTYDFQHRRPEAVPEGSRRHRPSLPARRVRRHDALAHRQRLQRRARDGEGAGARRRERATASSARRCCRSSIRSIAAKYGLEMPSFIVENVSVPPEVEQAIDKRSSMAAVGNLNDYVKYQMAQGMEKGGGAGGVATEMAVGMAMAQQMMKQPGGVRRAAPPAPARRGAAGRAAFRTCSSPADVGEGARRVRGRRDDDPRVGRAQGQEDRHVVAHQRRARSTSSWRSRSAGAEPSMADIAAAREASRARRAARRRSGIRPSRSSSARSAAPRRRYASTATPARSSSTISSRRFASCPTRRAAGRPRSARCSARAARRSRCSIPTRVGQNCDFCGSPALVDYEEIKAPIRPQSLLPFKVAESQVREQIRRWYASKWLAPGKLKSTRARRYASTASTFRTGRSTRRCVCPWEAEAGPLLLHDRDVPRQQGPHADAPGPARALGAGLGRASSTSSTTSRCRERRASRPRSAAQVEPFPTDGARAVRHRVPVGVRRRALSDRSARRGEGAREEAMTRQAARAVRARRCRATRTATCEIHPTFSAQTFKHILVPVWLLTYTLRREDVTRWSSTAYTGRMAGQYPKSPWKIAFLVLLRDFHRRHDV